MRETHRRRGGAYAAFRQQETESDAAIDALEAVRETMRRNVQTFGLKVICLMCRTHHRHRPETDGRLRERECPRCAVKALRSTGWVLKHQTQAKQLVADHRNGVRAFRA
jgi:hypothetical protein